MASFIASLPRRIVGRVFREMGYSRTEPPRSAPVTTLVCQHIPGWFSIREAEALYLLAATSSATRFLEIGHFLGRSTSVICESIRDTDRSITFNSYDLGFTNEEEFLTHYARVSGTATPLPPEYAQLVFSNRTTTTAIARKHLERFQLQGFVNLISGDFTHAGETGYGFVFCDALHDRGEIAINLPHVIAASADDCIWACHDMTPANVAAVLEHPGVHSAPGAGLIAGV